MLIKTVLSLSSILTLALSQSAVAVNLWKTVGDLPNYDSVSPQLLRGGQPSIAGMETLKQRGVKTIISLRNNKPLAEAEEAEAKKLGMTFYSMPLSGVKAPTTAMIHKFLDVVNDPAAQPVFVHCEEGVDRTGTMVALYRIDTEHWSADRAYKEMISHGFHPIYPWLSDAVFAWARIKGLPYAGRPFGLKVFDSLDHTLSMAKLNGVVPMTAIRVGKD